MMPILETLLNAGPTVMMPLVFTLVGVLLKVRFFTAFKAGLTIGIGFLGISVITNMLSDYIGDVVKSIADNYHLSLNVIDLGWPVAANIAFQSGVGVLIIPACMALNALMIVTKTTRTINIDIWNYWHFAFIGSVVYRFTASLLWGMLAGLTDFIITMVIADLTGPAVGRYYKQNNITFPNAYSASFVPLAYMLNALFERSGTLWKRRKKAKPAPILKVDALYIGLALGVFSGVMASYSVMDVFRLSVVMASMMVLIPRVSVLLAEGVEPISEAIKEKVKRSGKDSLSIGMTPTLVIGDQKLMLASILLIPIAVLISFLVPGNQFLPIASLTGLIYLLPLILAITGGSVARTLLIGGVVSVISNFIVTRLAPVVTEIAGATAIRVPDGALVASLDYAGSPLIYILHLARRYPAVLALLLGALAAVSLLVNVLAINRKKKQHA